MNPDGLDGHKAGIDRVRHALDMGQVFLRKIRKVMARLWRTARKHHRLNQAIHGFDQNLNAAVFERNHRLVALGQTLRVWLQEAPRDEPILNAFVGTLVDLDTDTTRALEFEDKAVRDLKDGQTHLSEQEAIWQNKIESLHDERRCLKDEWTHNVRTLRLNQKGVMNESVDASTAQPEPEQLTELGDRVADLELRLYALDGELRRQKHAHSEAIDGLKTTVQSAQATLVSAREKKEAIQSRHRATLMDLAREALLSPDTLVSQTLTDRARQGTLDVENLRSERGELVEERDRIDPRPYRLFLALGALTICLLMWALIF